MSLFNNADSWKLFIAEHNLFGIFFSGKSFSLWRPNLIWFHRRCLCKIDIYSPKEMHRTLQDQRRSFYLRESFSPFTHVICLAHLYTFIYAPQTKINWQMWIYKSLVVYTPESSRQHILIIMYYLWLYLVPVETEVKIWRHLIKFVSLVLI